MSATASASSAYAFEELDELVQAYAVTVDKVRGNEFPGVIIPLSMEQSVVLRREVLYTAVTRGQKLVVFVGDPEVLAAAVKRTDDHPRRTGLVERLMRGFSDEENVCEKKGTLDGVPLFQAVPKNGLAMAVRMIIHTGNVTTDASVVPATAVVANLVSA